MKVFSLLSIVHLIAINSFINAATLRTTSIENDVQQQILDNYMSATKLFAAADDAQKAMLEHKLKRSSLVLETVIRVEEKWRGFQKEIDEWKVSAREKNLSISACEDSMYGNYHKYIQYYQDHNIRVTEEQHNYFGKRIDGVGQTAVPSLQKTVELRNSVILCEDDLCRANILRKLKKEGEILEEIEAATLENVNEFLKQFPSSLEIIQRKSEELLENQRPLIDYFILCAKTILLQVSYLNFK